MIDSSISAPLNSWLAATSAGMSNAVRVAIALGQVDAEDFGPLLIQRQVNVEDLVQAPFAQQFRRELS